jgi:hypothetical protein
VNWASCVGRPMDSGLYSLWLLALSIRYGCRMHREADRFLSIPLLMSRRRLAGHQTGNGSLTSALRTESDNWGKFAPHPGRVQSFCRMQRGQRDCARSGRQTGEWILYPSVDGVSLASPDGKSRRTLTTRKFTAYGFSKSGEQVIGVFQNTAPDHAEWELYSVDVKTGAEKRLAALDLPPNVGEVAGFSLHPDGKRFATSIARWPYDIWMLEGFDQQKSWLDRLLRR